MDPLRALAKIELLVSEKPDVMNICKAEMDRSVVHSAQGILYNYATDTLIDHGFLVTEIRTNLPVLVWYADDDEDFPPTHGKWIANKNSDNTDKDNCNHFTNVSSRVFNKYGHTGTALVDREEFLKEFHGHTQK
mmetsp:Transcript_20778/g.45234  ORF Transcript_20778/g.45234 Transcript_20778/m.45234 type:complete len:134 (+) Transcript_20778:248-649(+)